MQEMQGVLKDNPEIYEKKLNNRGPASVPKESLSSPVEKLDQFEEQGSGPKSW